MLHQIQGSLRAWHPNGEGLDPKDFVSLLEVDSQGIPVVGSGQPWQAVRLVLCDIGRDASSQHKEPSEQFFSQLREMLIDASRWLSKIPKDAFVTVQERGFIVDFFIEMWIDQDQFEFDVPAEFALELGRLRITLKMLSND
ncbi:hypothetical protein [Tuwongella immobilis]|uniref:Uncharacterized protein n=1 Tax=Tuwongella immobilis TaxID=692036 RepID=A0A6C2YU46_9BACT|nr:hypothetical protein [Tuwongella immobilis]VIP05160.1 unnamed protein product [Tuwongella immobilis]VTS07676.1 unnamed protein product [Tuwongella immobilis]